VFCVSLYADWNEEQINEATTKACQRSYAFGKARPSPPWISCVRARVLVRACACLCVRACLCVLVRCSGRFCRLFAPEASLRTAAAHCE
jgi:hypothetical protein